MRKSFHRAVHKLQRRNTAPPHVIAHHHRSIGLRFAQLMQSGRSAWVAFLAVLGPGLLAGLSDDDPAGITTYSVLGTDFGYQLLWIIPASTVLLVQFHLIAVRIGAATGKGFVSVIRKKWGRTAGYITVVGLLLANFGTICAEYAGISAAGSLVGIPSWISAPAAGVLISLVVVLGSFHRVEKVLLVISATLALYIIDGFLAAPDWGAVLHNSVTPHMPSNAAGWIAIAAALGTTLAPWGLAFIQSYAVDKKITLETLRWARWDVIIGSVLTGIIGLAIAVACAATLNKAGVHIQDAGDAAKALQPLAGRFATVLFGAGLLGASLLMVLLRFHRPNHRRSQLGLAAQPALDPYDLHQPGGQRGVAPFARHRLANHRLRPRHHGRCTYNTRIPLPRLGQHRSHPRLRRSASLELGFQRPLISATQTSRILWSLDSQKQSNSD
jgi:Mn2+/Fe2+ NRAMP family transporter